MKKKHENRKPPQIQENVSKILWDCACAHLLVHSRIRVHTMHQYKSIQWQLDWNLRAAHNVQHLMKTASTRTTTNTNSKFLCYNTTPNDTGVMNVVIKYGKDEGGQAARKLKRLIEKIFKWAHFVHIHTYACIPKVVSRIFETVDLVWENILDICVETFEGE